MHVLVTGATGFLGCFSVAALHARGHTTRVLARSQGKVERVLNARGERPREIVVGDVTDPDVVAKALDGVDAVIHAAAVVAIEARRADEVEATNVRAVELVIGGAHERGLGAIVHISSIGALVTPGGPPVSQNSPLARPDNAYSRSKAEGEAFVRQLQQAGAPIRTLYPVGILGPDDPGLSESNHTVRTFIRDAMVDTTGGMEISDVRDLAEIVARLVEPESAPGRYVVGGFYLPWPELIALMDELTGRRVRRMTVPGPLLRVIGNAADVVKRVVPFDFPLSREAMQLATQWPGVVTSPNVEAMEIAFRDGRETYRETIRWLYETGHLTPEEAGLLAAADIGASASR
ncbi:MAG: NAD-dependent epimerase/dehydratase family protein [Myxococcota bacterium]